MNWVDVEALPAERRETRILRNTAAQHAHLILRLGRAGCGQSLVSTDMGKHGSAHAMPAMDDYRERQKFPMCPIAGKASPVSSPNILPEQPAIAEIDSKTYPSRPRAGTSHAAFSALALGHRARPDQMDQIALSLSLIFRIIAVSG